jgi:hypothetical protein
MRTPTKCPMMASWKPKHCFLTLSSNERDLPTDTMVQKWCCSFFLSFWWTSIVAFGSLCWFGRLVVDIHPLVYGDWRGPESEKHVDLPLASPFWIIVKEPEAGQVVRWLCRWWGIEDDDWLIRFEWAGVAQEVQPVLGWVSQFQQAAIQMMFCSFLA